MRIFRLLLLVMIFAIPASAQAKRAFVPFTQRLPNVDKVKLFRLYWADIEGMDRRRNGERLAEKTLKVTEARRIASLWRKLEYRPGLSACHEPHYSIEFYSKGRLIVRASVCWACNNILFSVPKIGKASSFENDTQNFDADGAFSLQLSELFRKTFESKTEGNN